MPLNMNKEVFITCAITGSGGTQDRSPHVPRSPKQIAESAIAAAKDPIGMARAMKHAVIAGREAYLAGRMGKKKYADPSSPLAGLI